MYINGMLIRRDTDGIPHYTAYTPTSYFKRRTPFVKVTPDSIFAAAVVSLIAQNEWKGKRRGFNKGI
jgi:hypothetical protein